jgi:hypothetical protein
VGEIPVNGTEDALPGEMGSQRISTPSANDYGKAEWNLTDIEAKQ